MVFAWVKHLLYPLMRVLWVRRIRGIECIPKTGPAIVIANHNSYMDGILLALAIAWHRNRKARYFMLRKYFRSRLLRFVFGTWFGQIPVNGALEKGLAVLQSGGVLGIFPEARRSSDGKMQRVTHSGLGVLALRSGAPIVPVGIYGTFAIWPRQQSWPKLFFARRVELHVANPLRFAPRRGETIKKKEAMAVVRKAMRAVAKIVGQEYTW